MEYKMSRYSEVRDAFIDVMDGQASVHEIVAATGLSNEEAHHINQLFNELLSENNDPYEDLLNKINEYLEFLKPALIFEGLHNACTAEEVKEGERLRSEITKLNEITKLRKIIQEI